MLEEPVHLIIPDHSRMIDGARTSRTSGNKAGSYSGITRLTRLSGDGRVQRDSFLLEPPMGPSSRLTMLFSTVTDCTDWF